MFGSGKDSPAGLFLGLLGGFWEGKSRLSRLKKTVDVIM